VLDLVVLPRPSTIAAQVSIEKYFQINQIIHFLLVTVQVGFFIFTQEIQSMSLTIKS
jgi:hypothetical protein